MSLLLGLYTVSQLQSEKICFIQCPYGCYVGLDTATMRREAMGRNRVTIPRHL